MRALMLLGIAMVIPAYADDEHRLLPTILTEAPWMTGEQLLQKLGRPADAAATADYIKGVYDATEHKDWCHIGPNGKSLSKPRPADMQVQVRTALSAMPAAQLRRSAATLLAEIWQEKWPCPPEGCCHD